MRRLHSIYRIVCFATGKSYIGQSLDSRGRFRMHQSLLRRGIHTNQKLQRAFDKYGKNSFYFEVIESDIDPQIIDEREQYWIGHFNAWFNGFNASPGGNGSNGKGKPIIWEGKEYDSVTAAANMLNINMTTLHGWVKRGYKCLADTRNFVAPNEKPITWNGVKYRSINAAARALNVSFEVIYSRIRAGYTCDSDVPSRSGCVWNGITYSSMREAAKANGIKLSTLKFRLRRGYKTDKEIKRSLTPCVWNGIEYPSIKQAAVANGISKTTMSKYLKKGYTQDSDRRS